MLQGQPVSEAWGGCLNSDIFWGLELGRPLGFAVLFWVLAGDILSIIGSHIEAREKAGHKSFNKQINGGGKEGKQKARKQTGALQRLLTCLFWLLSCSKNTSERVFVSVNIFHLQDLMPT